MGHGHKHKHTYIATWKCANVNSDVNSFLIKYIFFPYFDYIELLFICLRISKYCFIQGLIWADNYALNVISIFRVVNYVYNSN